MSSRSQEITIQMPKGERRVVAPGAVVRELVPPNRKDVIAVKVNGKVVDLSHPLETDCELEFISLASVEGLDVLRHSCAHLMAQAVKRLFPSVQITIGPVIKNGFYYDFKHERAFTSEDLEQIEAEMRKIVAENFPISREEIARDDAVHLFRSMGEDFKAEIIASIPGNEVISLYRQGEFVDLCRGPHLPATGNIPAFKLTSVAGAYWRGDARNEQLQRIYGTAWASQKDLDAYLKRLEEAKKRDHRRLGQALDLFSLPPISPGAPFFHPKGTIVYNLLVQYIRGLYSRYGYTEIITPLIYKTDLWKTSGHYEAFHDDMFLMDVEDGEYGVKPMNCPGHCYLFASRKHSYRDLPIRYADFSRLHRFERSGVLSGLTRVRSFAQDDAHIYCTPEQLDDELNRFIAMTKEVYSAFGFDRIEVTLQTRPEKFLGRIELWESAESALRRVLEQAGYHVTVLPGEGAFYGPKIGFDFRDVLERSWTLATVQIDCAMPERFGLSYVTPEGTEATPVMLHRAVLGSLERFMAILLEHCAGDWPLWLAPVQVRLLTVTDAHDDYARNVCDQLQQAGIRAELDLRNEKLGYKIREAEMQKVPYMVVIGDKEVNTATVAPRGRKGEKIPSLTVAELVARIATEAVPGGAP